MRLADYHKTLDVLHFGTTAPRAYCIPCATRQELDTGSSRMGLLSGQWQFAYYPSPRHIPQDAVLPHGDRSAYRPITVPGTWQDQGYDRHQYTNVRYPFPYDPPHVPEENPAGVYVRTFTVAPENPGTRQYLNFEGVDSCFYLYINGRFVGYSQVSHSTSEFDVTDALLPGENTLVVIVLKWCDGSYLEDQDKFRMSGIFRDVYLLSRPREHLQDYFLHQEVTREGLGRIRLELSGDTPLTFAALYAPDGQLLGEYTETADILLEDPVLWNAEEPRLYTLDFCAGGEWFRERVGLRRVEVRDGLLLLNGQKLRFNGVNRHDSDPLTGCAISREQAMADLRLMKAHNINAIRTSHYPNAPWFPQLCDEYGFYLITEADVETHGCDTIYKSPYRYTMDLLASDPAWAPAFLDRVQRCVHRDKNRPSILLWSLGNESGYGCCLEEAGKWVKTFDPSRLLHYEGVFWPTRSDWDTGLFDVHSRMYSSPEDIDRIFLNHVNPSGTAGKPFLLCEFIHAMGNGPGGGNDYFDRMEKYPGFCGGFVWEWCDHAIQTGVTEAGAPVYAYGGDHGENPHDGNFCVDGLVSPDRIPHTGLLEYAQQCRPLRARWQDGRLWLKNMLRFARAQDHFRVEISLTREGVPFWQTSLTPELAPMEEKTFPLTLPPLPDSGTLCLDLRYIQQKDEGLTRAGRRAGFDQIILRKDAPKPSLSPACLQWAQDELGVSVSGEGFRCHFSPFTGLPDSILSGKTELLSAPMEWNVWRAPTDNDRYIVNKWREAGYDLCRCRAGELTVSEEQGRLIVTCDVALAGVWRQPFLRMRCRWEMGEKAMTVHLTGRKDATFPYLPRFGLRAKLPKTFGRLRWLGYGPKESYADKRQAVWYGCFECAPEETYPHTLVPQEGGSHFATDSVTLQDATGAGLMVLGSLPFSFSALPYTQEVLEQARHDHELTAGEDTVLCLDFAHCGLGTNSCGPEVAEQYRAEFTDFDFTMEFSLL